MNSYRLEGLDPPTINFLEFMRPALLILLSIIVVGLPAAETAPTQLSVEERAGIRDLAVANNTNDLGQLKGADLKTVRAADGKILVPRLSNLHFLSDGRKEKLDVYLPPGATKSNRPAVLFIHGGGFKGGDKAEFRSASVSADFARAGYLVVSCNYMLASKKNPGVWPQNVRDCRDAVRWMRQNALALGIDPSRIAVAGGSAGGYLALMVGLSDDRVELGGDPVAKVSARVAGIINMYGVTDPTDHGKETLINAGPEAERLFSPVTHVKANSPPVLILHGSADTTVPLKESEDLVNALLAAKADHEFVVVKDAVHTFDLHPAGLGWRRVAYKQGVRKEDTSESPDLEAVTLAFLRRTIGQ